MTVKLNHWPIRRAVLLLATLLLTATLAFPASGVALALAPPSGGDNLSLVNRDRQAASPGAAWPAPSA